MPGAGYKFMATPQPLLADSPSTQPAQAQETARGKSSPSASPPRIVVPAAVVLLFAGLAWLGWSHWPASQQATETTPQAMARPSAPPAVSAERRALAFKRMVEALQDDRFSWRTIERLAIESGVDEAEAREILGEHLDEVVLGKSREGKLIAKLSAR
jgi:hypothetical protein